MTGPISPVIAAAPRFIANVSKFGPSAALSDTAAASITKLPPPVFGASARNGVKAIEGLSTLGFG